MENTHPAIQGVSARSPRPTFRGRLWLASMLSLPVLALLGSAEIAWRLLF